MCGLPKPTSNVPAQTKRHALTALRPYRWPPHGLPFVPKWFRRWAPAFDEGLLQSGQLAVLESQSETVLERRGIHGQVLHPQVDQVVGCLEAAVPSNIDGSETDRRRGKPVLGTWTVGEESIPIRRQRHRSHSRTLRTQRGSSHGKNSKSLMISGRAASIYDVTWPRCRSSTRLERWFEAEERA